MRLEKFTLPPRMPSGVLSLVPPVPCEGNFHGKELPIRASRFNQKHSRKDNMMIKAIGDKAWLGLLIGGLMVLSNLQAQEAEPPQKKKRHLKYPFFRTKTWRMSRAVCL